MFAYNQSLKKINLKSFNTKNVEDMSSMFSGCSSLEELDLSNFNTKNVETMYALFYGCTSLKNLKIFKISKKTNVDEMFEDCDALKESDKLLKMNSCICI